MLGIFKCSRGMISGPNAMSRLQFGMVQQPWFIGTVIGTVGGALWFALCVFSLWLCRRRQRRRKYPRSNGVVSGMLRLLYPCSCRVYITVIGGTWRHKYV